MKFVHCKVCVDRHNCDWPERYIDGGCECGQVDPKANRPTPEVYCRECEYALYNDCDNKYSCIGPLTSPWDYYEDKPNIVEVPPDGFCHCAKPRKETNG